MLIVYILYIKYQLHRVKIEALLCNSNGKLMKASNRAGFIMVCCPSICSLSSSDDNSMLVTYSNEKVKCHQILKHSPEQSRLEASPTALFTPDTTP